MKLKLGNYMKRCNSRILSKIDLIISVKYIVCIDEFYQSDVINEFMSNNL